MKPYFLGRLGVMGALFLAAAVAQPAGQFHLPHGFRRVRIGAEVGQNLLMVHVRVNGSPPLRFIVDTGVRQTLLIEPGLAPLLALGGGEPAPLLGLGAGDTLQAIRVRGVQLELPNGVLGQGMEMLVLPPGAVDYSGLFGHSIAGILGGDLFMRFAVEVDYGRHTLTLHEPAHLRPRTRWARLPLRIVMGKPYAEAALVLPGGDTLWRQFLLDTGAGGAALFRQAGLSMPEAALPAHLGMGLAGQLRGRLGRFPALRLGRYVFAQAVVGVPDSAGLAVPLARQGYYANIGGDLLSRFRIIFDYARKELWLRPGPRFNAPFYYNRSGIELEAFGPGLAQVRVMALRPGSAAEAAGLRLGDEIRSINGYRAAGQSLGQLYAQLNGRPGQACRIGALREGRPFRIGFEVGELL